MDLSVVIYDNYYKGYSQPGTSSVTIITGCGFQPWQRFESDCKAGRKKEYLKEKAISGLSSLVKVMEAATPLTNWRYTLNPEGAIYGFPFSVDNSFMNRIKNLTPIKGLYLACAWGYAGGGYAPRLKGGERTFKQVLEDLA